MSSCSISDICGRCTPYPIKDFIWFAGGSLLVGAGHQILQYGSLPFTLRGPAEQRAPTLFERVARQNGPLPDYHPQNLLQCLLWGMMNLACACVDADLDSPAKLELVKQIIVKLAFALEASHASNGEFIWTQFPVSEYTGVTTRQGVSQLAEGSEDSLSIIQTTVQKKSQYSYLFVDLVEEPEKYEVNKASCCT